MGQSTSAPKITAQDRAIYKLKEQRDSIRQYQRKLSRVVDRQTELAKLAVKNNQPDRAKFYLRSKKQQETVISKTFDQLDNLESLIGTIEFKSIEKDVLYGLQQGNKVLVKLNNEMSVERIDKVLDQLEDERIKVEEISDALGMGSGLNKLEETEVDEEFAKLNEEIHGPEITLPDAHTGKILPNVPTTEIEEEEEEQQQEQTKTKQQANEPLAV
ncbi:Charged multivesicular body protein 6 [Spathaspora sp. JA1]|nr:Charged multivesicular body protein 6 [Spathaspora sp. JA1]